MKYSSLSTKMKFIKYSQNLTTVSARFFPITQALKATVFGDLQMNQIYFEFDSAELVRRNLKEDACLKIRLLEYS